MRGNGEAWLPNRGRRHYDSSSKPNEQTLIVSGAGAAAPTQHGFPPLLRCGNM